MRERRQVDVAHRQRLLLSAGVDPDIGVLVLLQGRLGALE